MRPEDRLLVIASRRHLDEAHRLAIMNLCGRPTLDWRRVCSTAVRHGVAPLLYAHLAALPATRLAIPQDVLSHLRLTFVRNRAWKEWQASGLVAALTELNRCGLGAMLIKGAALDFVVYGPRPYTTSRDIDLVLPARREALTEAEWAAVASIDGKCAIEYDFYEHHDLTIDGIVPIDFGRIWADATTAAYRGQRVRLMCPEDMFIAACINACRHHFLRLKNLCDVAELTRAFPALHWRTVTDRARAQACGAIVYAALRLVQRTVGCQLPSAMLDDLGVSAARRTLIEVTSSLLLRLPLTAAEVGPRLDGRPMRLALLLPYLAYDRHQLRRKLAYLRAKRFKQLQILHSAG